MSQRRQDARKAQQDRRRQERRNQRVEQRRVQQAAPPPAAGPTTTRQRAGRTATPTRTRRNMRPWWIAAGVVGGVAAAVLIYVIVKAQLEPLPGTKYESNGNQHVVQGEAHGAYFSNPPTSGWHLAEIPNPGIYNQPRTPESLGHFMEHGGVWVLYTCPDGCPDLVQQLTGIVNGQIDRNKPAALAPYPAQGYTPPENRINVIAWQYKLALDDLDRGAINNFIERHACRYTPEGSGPGCAARVRGKSTEVKDAGAEGFNAVTAPPAASPTTAPAPAATPAAAATSAATGAAGPTPPPTGTPAQ